MSLRGRGICGREQADGTICTNAAGCRIPHPAMGVQSAAAPQTVHDGGYSTGQPEAAPAEQEAAPGLIGPQAPEEAAGRFSIVSDRAAETVWSGSRLRHPVTGRSIYTHPVSGHRLPSVTAVLRVLDKPALTGFAVLQVAQEAVNSPYNPDTETEQEAVARLKQARWATASKGTRMHSHIERDAPLDGIDDDERGYVAAARDAMASLGLRPLAHEAVIWGDGYAGRVDMIAEDADGMLVVVDWKTTTKEQPRVYSDALCQVAAYSQMEYITAGDGQPVHGFGPPRTPPIGYGLVVSVNAQGRWAAARVSASPDSPHMDYFRECLRMMRVRDAWESRPGPEDNPIVGQATGAAAPRRDAVSTILVP